MNSTPQETILIIDDDQSVRQGLSFYLENFGYHILTAEDGRTGVDLFDSRDADLVLVDLSMPEMDGFEVLDRIACKSPYTPLIVITGAQMLKDAVEAMQHGAWDYLVKPINDTSKLSEAIENGLLKAHDKKEQFVNDVNQALGGLKMLKGVLPMCSFCKKIRVTQGVWENVDAYIAKNSQAKVSHTVCDECGKLHYSQFWD